MSVNNVAKISELDFICYSIYNKALKKVLECLWIVNRKMDFSESFETLKDNDQCFV